MRISSGRLNEIGSWTLVLCALLTTILVVRREFAGDAVGATTINPPASYDPREVDVDGWQAALGGGIRFGRADAPVQVVEFADFQCPYCASFEATVSTVRSKYPDHVAFTFAHYPLPQHSLAESAARASECADIQGRFEEMRSLLFTRQRTFGSVPWTDFAKDVGILDLEQFDVCVNDTRPVERIERGKKVGVEIGVRGTPTIIVNGWRLPLPPTAEQFDEIVRNVMDGRPPVEGIDFI